MSERSCWEELGLQEQLGVCDTEMSPANFRGAKSKRKDILLELSVDFLVGSCRSPGSLLSHKTPPRLFILWRCPWAALLPSKGDEFPTLQAGL